MAAFAGRLHQLELFYMQYIVVLERLQGRRGGQLISRRWAVAAGDDQGNLTFNLRAGWRARPTQQLFRQHRSGPSASARIPKQCTLPARTTDQPALRIGRLFPTT